MDKKNAYEVITDQLIAALESGQLPPWRRPWRATGGMPRNLASGKAYRGANIFTLALQASAHNYSAPYWLTYKQAQERGGHVRSGQKGTKILFWKFGEGEDKETGEVHRSVFARSYTVFNADQCEGLAVPTEEAPYEHEPITAAEAIAANMPQRPAIVTQPNKANYVPLTDTVGIPPLADFASPEQYYSTLYHELAHATGHPDRLARFEPLAVPKMGSDSYSLEELTAEMTAAILCGHASIETATLTNSTAYIKNWLTALKDDKRMLVKAAGLAQRAADFILNA